MVDVPSKFGTVARHAHEGMVHDLNAAANCVRPVTCVAGGQGLTSASVCSAAVLIPAKEGPVVNIPRVRDF